MREGLFNTVLSATIIVVAVVFFGFILYRTGTGHMGSYHLVARMDNAAGLRVGTDVRISGVKIGRVAALSLDSARRAALVDIEVRDDLALPADSTVTVSSQMMSDVSLTITPGHAVPTIPPGGRVAQWRAPRKPPRFVGS
jgi:phospholipid/cholesterol/gamma-HCH transport system substrate-binding protein